MDLRTALGEAVFKYPVGKPTSKHTESTASPNIPPLQVNKGITIVTTDNQSPAGNPDITPEDNPSRADLTLDIAPGTTGNITPTKTMDKPLSIWRCNLKRSVNLHRRVT